jgi:hypothetical protein
MVSFHAKASMDLKRSTHPDISVTGDLMADAYLPPDRRDFHRLRADPVRWQAFMAGVAARQAREHPDVQGYVAGVEYGGDVYDGYQAYQADLQAAREIYGRSRELTSYDVANMTLEEYDRAFDEKGQPREGVSFRVTDRDVVADADQGVDRFSRMENVLRARDQAR